MAGSALPRAACRGRISIERNLRPLAPNQFFQHLVKVKNESAYVWPSTGANCVNLSYHWLDQWGRVLVRDGLRTVLHGPLAPGQEAFLFCCVQTPERVGSYELEFDLVQEQVRWFGARGGVARRLPCEIVPRPDTHRLRFTGDCSEEEFRTACAQQGWWYHSYYFDNGFAVKGYFDIGRNIQEYGFPDDMTGMTVLDVGTGSGWFSFYCEQRGAEVTAVDIRGVCDYDVQGQFETPPLEAEKPAPDEYDADGRPLYFSRVSRGLWVMRKLLRSQVQYRNARVYDLCPELFGGKTFDLVFLGSLLLHLRDPIGALMAARRVCRDRLIATTRVMADGDSAPHPQMDLVQGIWWFPNKSCYRQWFLGAGFRAVDVDRTLTLTAEDPPQDLASLPNLIPNVTQILQVADARV